MNEAQKIPAEVGAAEERYLSAARDELQQKGAAKLLLEQFGPVAPRNTEHRRIGRLCILATRRFLPIWTEQPCDNMEPIGAVNVSVKWLSAGISPHRWDQVCRYSHPRCQGQPLYDCMTPLLSCIAMAAAATARFARFGNLSDAAEALHWALLASLHGNDPPDRFATWLVSVALPAAYNFRRLRKRELFA